MQRLLFWTSVSAFLSVALGAFGAHGLKKILSPESLGIFETGVRYQFYHSLAALCICAIGRDRENLLKSISFFLYGNILFSGSLYLLALTGIRALGMITPLGGVLYLIGWAFLIYRNFPFRNQNERI